MAPSVSVPGLVVGLADSEPMALSVAGIKYGPLGAITPKHANENAAFLDFGIRERLRGGVDPPAVLPQRHVQRVRVQYGPRITQRQTLERIRAV